MQHFLRGQQRAIDIGAGQHHRELVAAETRDGVGLAEHAADARRDALQDAVAGVMPHRVVDLLEAVQIEDQQRARRLGAVGDAQRLGETIVQQQPVRQIGQRIVIGQVRDPLLDPAPLAPRGRFGDLALDRRGEPLDLAFEDVVARADPHRRDGGVFAAGTGHHDARQLGVALADHLERRGSREPGHRVTGDDDVPGLAIERPGQRRGIFDASGMDIVAAALKRAHHERLVLARVFDQQQLKS